MTAWMIGSMDAASVVVWRAVLVRLDRCSLHRSNIRYRCHRHHDTVGYVSDVVAVVGIVSLDVWRVWNGE